MRFSHEDWISFRGEAHGREAERTDDHDYLHGILAERLQYDRIVFPATSTLERMVGQARTEAQERINSGIVGVLDKNHCDAIDDLQLMKRGSRRSYLQWIKDAVAFASPRMIVDLVERIEYVRRLGLPTNALESVHPDMRRRMSSTVQVYSVDNLFMDFAVKRRRAFLVCYLHERQQALVDLAVEAFDQVIAGMCQRSESDRDETFRRTARAINEKLHLFGAVAEVLLDDTIADHLVRQTVFANIPPERLAEALSATRRLTQPEDFNCFDFLRRRYRYLRSFFPRFLAAIEFESSSAGQNILQAVKAVRYWNAEAIRRVPASAPLDFVPDKWRSYVCPNDGAVDRRNYEICLALQLHQALKSGDIWAVGGRRYGNVEDLLISQEQWAQVREECYAELNLPKDPRAWLDSSLEKLQTQIDSTSANFAANQQVFVEDGRVHLTTIDASELPERVAKLKERIHESWPQMRIQDLLIEVDSWVNFTGYFRSLRGRRASIANFLKGALASLIAKGCNIGIQKMAALTPGLGKVTLHRINELYLHEGTLRGIIDHFVATAHSLPVSQFLGDEKVSMSDGMRLRTRVKTIHAAFMPKHFAPGQRAITYYWHVSHQGPGYAAQVFGNDRDAAYVLDQIHHIRSELPIQEHCTDTHGVTETIFALAEPFGIQIAPRIKLIHAQQLDHPPGMKVTGAFKAHFAGPVDVELIARHWDDYVRILASINRGITSNVLLSQRLNSYASENPLYRVIREVGRIWKTRHILQVYGDPEFRRRISAGLDRVENFNNLARHLFFARRDENWERELEEQLNRASSLMILADACILWNIVHLSERYQQLMSEGFDFQPADFRHVSPYAFEHIIPYGQYFFNVRRKDRKNAFENVQKLLASPG